MARTASIYLCKVSASDETLRAREWDTYAIENNPRAFDAPHLTFSLPFVLEPGTDTKIWYDDSVFVRQGMYS